MPSLLHAVSSPWLVAPNRCVNPADDHHGQHFGCPDPPPGASLHPSRTRCGLLSDHHRQAACLRTLELLHVSGSTDEDAEAALAALPGSRLTKLFIREDSIFLKDVPARCWPWPRLQELRADMLLPASIAGRIACGLPELRVLEVIPEGDWRTEAAGAVFSKLERVAIYGGCSARGATASVGMLSGISELMYSKVPF